MKKHDQIFVSEADIVVGSDVMVAHTKPSAGRAEYISKKFANEELQDAVLMVKKLRNALQEANAKAISKTDTWKQSKDFIDRWSKR